MITDLLPLSTGMPMYGTSTYSRNSDLGGASPRETEAVAFGLCNARLIQASTAAERVAALHKTHLLWAILVRDLSNVGNRLPEQLRQQLLSLGVWAMAYSVGAMTSEVSLQPLIEVNRNLADGLRTPAATVLPPMRTELGMRSFSA
jgi:flagellar protein FlaF